MAAFVAALLCSNLIGVHKVSSINLPFYGEYIYGAGVLVLPDQLSFQRHNDRGLRLCPFASGSLGRLWCPHFRVIDVSGGDVATGGSDDVGEHQSAVNFIFGQTARITLASLVAFWAGEFINSFVLAKVKVWTEGRFLWVRTIGSTFAGEAVDSVIFYPIAFIGTWSNEQVVSVMIGNYFIKVLWEIVATPATYAIVNFLKKAEHEDFYDRDTDFNPFTLDT